jgi:hypothetical protein
MYSTILFAMAGIINQSNSLPDIFIEILKGKKLPKGKGRMFRLENIKSDY